MVACRALFFYYFFQPWTPALFQKVSNSFQHITTAVPTLNFSVFLLFLMISPYQRSGCFFSQLERYKDVSGIANLKTRRSERPNKRDEWPKKPAEMP
jgi:hypothetical protein